MIFLSSFNTNSVKGWVKKIFPSLRKTQVVNLALGIVGIVKSRSGLMSEMVREVPGAEKHKHRLKRLWRFMSNLFLGVSSPQQAAGRDLLETRDSWLTGQKPRTMPFLI